jgi:hypothetical protein
MMKKCDICKKKIKGHQEHNSGASLFCTSNFGRAYYDEKDKLVYEAIHLCHECTQVAKDALKKKKK